MLRLTPLLVLAAAVAVAVSTTAAQEGTKADVRGTVAEVNLAKPNAAGILGVILVEGKKEATTAHDKASVRITTRTKLVKLVGKECKAATIDDLKKGARVQANFVGPVAESYPVQATAGAVLILEAAK